LVCIVELRLGPQVVTLKWRRRLITMRKTREAAPGEVATCALTEAGGEVAHEDFAGKYYGERAGGAGGADASADGSGESKRARRKAKREKRASAVTGGGEPAAVAGGEGGSAQDAAKEGAGG